MKKLTDEQKESLAEAFFMLRMDAVLASNEIDEEDDITYFSKGFLALIKFLKSMNIEFTKDDMDFVVDWNPKETP